MKNFSKIILAGLVLLMFASSCEDFLEKNPLDKISSQTFWKNEADAKMGLAGVYQALTQVGYADGWYNHSRLDLDALTDDCYLRHGHGQLQNIAKGLAEPSLGGAISSVYSQSYKGISRCNIFLDNIGNAEMDETLKKQFIGEVLFLRSYFYFTLTEFYGGVPLYTTAPTVEDSKVKQSSKTEVVTQILTDLDQAINSLPDVAYNGHAVKGSALALKAKVLMHNEKWADAAVAANQVIQSGVFSLYNSFPDLFMPGTQDGNREIVFSTKYELPDNISYYGPDIINWQWMSNNPMQSLVDEYECTDGMSISESSLYNPEDMRANRDPRLGYTIRFQAEGETVNGVGEMNFSETGYAPKKYINPANIPTDYGTKSDQDYIHLRYANVLLIYAESQNEATGPDQSVYDAINEIRTRPGIDMPELTAGLSKDKMREAIRHERRVELGGEGFRYFDIIRWRTAENIIPNIVDPGGNNRAFDPAKNYLFPFPQSERDINENLDQNPNY
ncbi:MAG: RagB/SusD family nutrient uptake outer membrane protein [Bacteroidota bacterium]